MSGIQTILPSARVFTGPGDRLFGYDRIWVIIYAGIAKTARINAPTTYDPGHHLIKGRCGHDGSDLELITHILQQATKGTVGVLRLYSSHPGCSHVQRLHMLDSMKHFRMDGTSRIHGTINHLREQETHMLR
jgi:hypothetical protein